MNQNPEIVIEIKKLVNQIKRQIHNAGCFAEHNNLTGIHGWIIGYIYHHADQDVFQKDIEEQLSVRRSTATGILQLMEKNGLIIRESVPYDARLKKLILTEKALKIHRNAVDEMSRINTQLMHNISPEELALFSSVIAKMRENLRGDKP